MAAASAVRQPGGRMISQELRRRRIEVLDVHFRSEVDHDWPACLGTFNGHPRYEIMATGQVHDGDAAALTARAQRPPEPRYAYFPSWRNQPSVSSTPQDSARRPPSTRYTVVPGFS